MRKFRKIACILMIAILFQAPVTTIYAEETTEQQSPVEDSTKENLNENETTNESEVPAKDPSKEEKEVIQKTTEVPASVTGEKYQGSGTVVDFTTTASKAFYTIKTKDNLIYYIVIDLDKTEDNVYFLSALNGNEIGVKDIVDQNTDPTPIQPVEQEEAVQAEETKSGGGNTLFYLLIVLLVVGVLGYGYKTKLTKGGKKFSFADLFNKEKRNQSEEFQNIDSDEEYDEDEDDFDEEEDHEEEI